MISFEEALATVLANARPMGTEELPLLESAGCCLAEPIAAPCDVPRFDNSAVDGFGLRLADLPVDMRLELAGTVRAGDSAEEPLADGAAVKVLTGAPVPAGVDAVVMKEHCAESDGLVTFSKAPRPGENIRRQGEEFRCSDIVLTEGTRITPPVVGLLASFGYSRVRVYGRPSVALVVTGNELVEPGEPPSEGQIYDSNSYALSAALQGLGIRRLGAVRVSDDLADTREKIRCALAGADVLITVGGVSVGDFDFVKEAFCSLGVRSLYQTVAMKPGKPNFFGVFPSGDRQKLVFGLPGNPVAALLSLHLLVKPAILKMMGTKDAARIGFVAELSRDLRKKPGRLEFVRGYALIEDGRLVVAPTRGQDSHMLGGLAEADCLIRFPQEKDALSAGTQVEIELLEWKG